MNVNSGGPHILLFERDQQLTAILTSEFQLAGYECHAARTAVEVFDAIARHPIRLVLVNLAQAAAGRGIGFRVLPPGGLGMPGL